MTLDIAKFISNSIRKQAKIQHLDISVKTSKPDSLPQSITSLISKEYGDNYILDADFVSFFWGKLSRDEIKRLFNVVDQALGKSANKLTETDFKKLPYVDKSDKDSDDGEEEVEVDTEVDVEEPEDDASDGQEDEDSQDDEEDSDDEEDADDDNDDDEKELNEDDNADELNVPTAYFFLKITTK